MFPEVGETRKHCFLAMSPGAGQTRNHYILAMLSKGRQTRKHCFPNPYFLKVHKQQLLNIYIFNVKHFALLKRNHT